MWPLALHSVSYAGGWGQAALPLAEFLPRAQALGYHAVMLMARRPHASPLDLDTAARARLREALQQHHLALACLAGYNDCSLGWERPEIPAAELHVSYLHSLARLAADLGAPLLRVFTAFERDDAPYHDLFRRTAAILREAASRAADLGVTLAVQNHHDLAAHHLTLRDLLEEVDHPHCRAAFDAWAPALQGEDLAAAVHSLAPWIVHTTVADYQRRPRFQYRPQWIQFERRLDAMRMVPFGEGCVDYATFFAALRAVGYQGAVAFEICAPLQGGGSEANLDACARSFVTAMRERYGVAG